MDAMVETSAGQETEGPWPLPEGWCWARVSDLPIGGDGSIEPSRTPQSPFVLYSVPAFEAGVPEFVKGSQIESNKQLVPSNALLISKINPRISRVWKVVQHPSSSGPVIASTEWIVIREAIAVEQDFLRYYLSTERVRQFLASNVSGVGGSLMRVNAATVGSISFPLAPIAEQRRIVARIDALFAEIGEGEVALAAARKGLEMFRRALLKAAVTGELTKEWRETNPVTETGHHLLSRLRSSSVKTKRRRTAWQPRADLPNLPEGWAWCAVDEAGDVQLGRQRAPQHHTGEHMRPYLRVANVLEDRLDLTDVKVMNFTPEEFETFALQSGDILLNEGQAPDLLGRPAMYRGEIVGCCFQKTLLRFRATDPIDPSFALLVFRHYMHSGRFKRESRITTNIGHLTQVRFVEMEFPIPPPTEVAEILRLVSDALAATDDTQAMLDAEAADAARLRQSVLKAAFEGRLVPQDPADGPAADMLGRLAASTSPASRARKKRAP